MLVRTKFSAGRFNFQFNFFSYLLSLGVVVSQISMKAIITITHTLLHNNFICKKADNHIVLLSV